MRVPLSKLLGVEPDRCREDVEGLTMAELEEAYALLARRISFRSEQRNPAAPLARKFDAGAREHMAEFGVDGNTPTLEGLRRLAVTGQTLVARLRVEDLQSQQELAEIYSLAELLAMRLLAEETPC